MKKTLGLIFLFLCITFFSGKTEAATPTFTYNGTNPVTITITSSTTATIVADITTANVVPYDPTKTDLNAIKSYDADVCVVTDQSATACNESNDIFYKRFTDLKKTQHVNFTAKNLNPSKLYYLLLVVTQNGQLGNGIVHAYPYKFFTATPATSLDAPIISSNKSGDTVTISARIDGNKYPNYADFSASLIYSKDASLANPVYGGALTGRPSDSPTTTTTGPSQKEADRGTFYWSLTHLDINTQYYFQVTVKTKEGLTSQSPIEYFNSTDGTAIAPGSAAATADLNTRSYALLAPFPGFSVLPDPDLCAQQRAAGENPKFCDLNDVINYFIKLLISITGVVLVLRLMYEGYQYMTTDVPFLKASAKSGFFVALGGLLFALTSYIILNTINPKLVEESVGLQQLSIGVDQTSLDSKTFQSVTGETLKTKSAYIPIAKSVAGQYGVDACIVEATIQQESEWNAAAIGCDEDQPSASVPSRVAFVGSGITYSGTPFSQTTDPGSSQRNAACTFDASKPGFGLDWRFSKGGGLMQVTIFPQGYKSSAWYSGVKQGGLYWNNRTVPYTGWQTLIKPETNIAQGTKLLKQALTDCNGDIQGAFIEYNTGSCTTKNSYALATAAQKMSIYNSCKSGASI